jgi:glycerol-3-phosphate dehydrogenase (NAD(P)+)
MKITVIGCGRWGSFICWYLNSIGNETTLYGRRGDKDYETFLATRSNGTVTMPESVILSDDIHCVVDSDIIVISVGSQNLRSLMGELSALSLKGKTYLLCMKGIEIGTGKRLSEIVREYTDPTSGVAVWLGPGHPAEFIRGVPNCMVIDSDDDALRRRLADEFTSPLIRFYYGDDLIGSEIGGAAKNVLGIAAGMLDGLSMSTLKGALMSRGTREVARLIGACGGKEITACGLCLLGDYEATLFSPHSHNRMFGEMFVRGEHFDALAEGYYTVKAMMKLSEDTGTELPICATVYSILYEGADIKSALGALFSRTIKKEFE